MSKTVKGLEKVLKSLNKLPQDLNPKIDATLKANADEIARNAKRLAPVDLGKLRQSIALIKVSDKEYKVIANASNLAPYAAYVEFGTGGYVRVPAEMQDIAILFKGKGIKEVNIRPQPYLYPALISQRAQYLKDLEVLLDKETKKI